MTEDTSRREYPRHELGCFYSGTVDGDPYSAVTVSLCHGMVSQTVILNPLYFLFVIIRFISSVLLNHPGLYESHILHLENLI
mgnify:CR=1 FL=1